MKRFILASLLFVFGLHTFAQKAPIRFGKPSMEDLKKTVYDIDTSAAAIVLCNYGYFDASSLDFVRITRLKILKKSGLKYATFTFRSLTKASIRGKTFNLVNGKMVVDKLSSKSIFDEEIYNGLYVTKVTMPNVKKGSVIDISVSYQGIPYVWYFQKDIPMLYSELDMAPSQYIEFRKNYFGYIPFTIANNYRWVTRNVPAFQPEPYMGAEENYLAHFEFDITSITLPEQMTHEYSTSWKRVNERLLNSAEFGGAMKNNLHFFKVLADSINAVAKTDEEKVRMALDKVHHMHWNGLNRLYTTTNTGLKYFFNGKDANSAEINLSLINLLRKLGFETYPVVTRTRDQGQLSAYNPTLQNLNYVLAYAKIGDRFYLLDGTDRDIPFPLLPTRCMNGRGRLVGYDTTGWVRLTNNARSVTRALYSLQLDENGNLQGTSTTSYSGYAGYRFRENYKNTGSHDDYVDQKMNDNPSLRIKKDTLENLENIYAPVMEKTTLTLKNQSFAMDSLVYLNVTPVRIKENPFKQETRKYPVDFIHPLEKTYTVLITLPKNYQVVKLPQQEKLVLPNKAGYFIYRIAAAGNHLSLNYRFVINKTVFLQTEYKLLKAFFMEAINKEAEPVVLKTL